MRGKIQYLIYLIPLLITSLVEGFIQIGDIDEGRGQLYVPLLAVFPFVYLLQGMLITKYGGGLLMAGIITSFVYLSATFLFLNYVPFLYVFLTNTLIFLGAVIFGYIMGRKQS